MARRWQRAAAAGQRVCGDLGRQWQSGKGPQRSFVSRWAAHVLKPSKWSMATWPGAGKGLPLRGNVLGSGKAVKAHRGVLCPDGPCFAHVLKPSKWSMATWPGAGKGLPLQGNVFAVTWEGSGKAVKAHRGVLCPDGPCFAQVLKPSKLEYGDWPGAGKGLPLQGNVFAVTWEGSGKAVKAHRGVLCRDGPCFAHVLKPSKWSMATCHLDGPVNEKGG